MIQHKVVAGILPDDTAQLESQMDLLSKDGWNLHSWEMTPVVTESDSGREALQLVGLMVRVMVEAAPQPRGMRARS